MLYRHLSVNVSSQGNTTAFWTGRKFSETGLFEYQAYIELHLSRNQDHLLGATFTFIKVLYEDTLFNCSLQCQQAICRLSNSTEDLRLELPSKGECLNAEAVLTERLESMKRSRSGLIGFVTKLQNELEPSS